MAKAIENRSLVPITSPVDFISGPSTISTPLNLANGNTLSLTETCVGTGAESIPWCFTEKQAIAPHRSEKVPVLIDGETSVADSWAIANYLEDHYPDRPSLFGGEGGRAVGRMINWWGDVTVVGGMFPLIVAAYVFLLDTSLKPAPDEPSRWTSLGGRVSSMRRTATSIGATRLLREEEGDLIGRAAPPH